MKAMRLALAIVAGVLSLAVASPAVAAPPTIDDEPMTVTREDALDAYAANPDDIFQDCGDFVVLAAFATDRRRVITFADRQLVLVSFAGELFRPDTGVAVTYAGSARIEFTFDPSGEIETITETGLKRYLIDLEGKRIVFDAGFTAVDLSSFPPIEHGPRRYEEAICGALA
jgi:hypothetical protein